MNYYILPKINKGIPIIFNLIHSSNELTTYISHSLFHYLTEIKKKIWDDENIQQAINPYEYIFTKIPNSFLSVSKLNPYSNTFYEFMELAYTINLFESVQDRNICSIYIGKNSTSVLECINILREDKNDIVVEKRDNLQSCIDFIYYELNDYEYMNNKKYILGLLYILKDICLYQSIKGLCIIKINDIFYKPVIEVLFILSSLYTKCHIIKPNTSSIISSNRYLVCKFFHNQDLQQLITNLNYIIAEIENNIPLENHIYSLTNNEIPYYFLTKIEESNIIIGQEQLESYDQMITIVKNKNKEDKLETLRKHHIQKCIFWCEKYKIPFNKLNERMNIFRGGSTSIAV